MNAAVVALVGALAMVAVACGPSSAPATSPPEDAPVARIGLAAGDLDPSVADAVELAVRRANDERRVEGWRLETVTVPSPQQLAGMVVSTSPAEAAAAVAAGAGAGVAVLLASPPPDPLPTAGTGRAFALVPPDARQGALAAQHARYQGMAVAAVATGTAEGTRPELTQAFRDRFLELGGRVVAVDEADDEGADLAYVGGDVTTALRLTRELPPEVPVVGGDPFRTQGYLEQAGEAAEGDLAVAPRWSSRTEPGQEFLGAYEDAQYRKDPGTFGVVAYDATNVLIQAMADVLPGRRAVDDATQAEIVQSVAGSDLEGATGSISFGPDGQRVDEALELQRVQAGVWRPA